MKNTYIDTEPNPNQNQNIFFGIPL